MYLNCPVCGLSIKRRFEFLTVEHCPRCVARRRLAVPLASSPQPLRLLGGGRFGRSVVIGPRAAADEGREDQE
jgi:hypothetical protein